MNCENDKDVIILTKKEHEDLREFLIELQRQYEKFSENWNKLDHLITCVVM